MIKHFLLKKKLLLIIATIVLLLVSYRFAFKNTFGAWQSNRQLKAELSRSTDMSYQPGYLKRKNDNLGKIINLYKTDTAIFRNNGINLIAGIAEKEGVKLSEVPTQDPFYQTDKFVIQKLGFEGNYFSLTKVLKQLQSTPGIGVIRSAVYKITGTNVNNRVVLEICLEICR